MDPIAHKEAKPRLQTWTSSMTGLHLICTNFRNIKKAVQDVDLELEYQGVNGILMDLGMSSMQVVLTTLKAFGSFAFVLFFFLHGL